MTLAVPLISSQAQAGGELDHESQVTNIDKKTAAAALPPTVVVRINNQDHTRAVFISHQLLPANDSSQAAVNHAQFVPVTRSDQKLSAKELDQDSSTDSWYFGFGGGYGYGGWGYGGWGYPSFSYYGYNYGYMPYYGYSYGPYSYAYYGNPYFYY